jgi:hypothetical protein
MTSATQESRSEKGLARAAQSLASWTEKWFPDAYVFALVGVVLVAVAALANGSSADGRRCFRRRLLGSDRIHPADGHGGADRIRRRHVPAGGQAD